MQVVVAEHDHPVYAQLIAEQHPQLQVLASSDPSELRTMAGQASVWLGEPDLLADLLRHGLKPAWLQSTWAGVTPLLAPDLPRDYLLTRAVGIFGQVMAEYVLTYLLNHERQVLSRLIHQTQRRWDGRPGQSLAGREVLIVGCGEIGQQVAQYLVGFGLRVRGIASQARDQAPFIEVAALSAVAQWVTQADYVINLLPDTPATHDLYDAALLARFKPGALFINAGRGVAVVDADLVQALECGHLAGAVIDVCREEPLPTQHPFWHAPGLILTGHSSAPTSPVAMVELFLHNLQGYQAGQGLRGVVNFQRGY
ncbi:D-2-hydroxyacid dehydrogenase [Pseudomonas sp. RP23018S]|uniref:D-2-hydroxyacid dehydrogenase n=1 Tax=Pseudomonas sp. RP23018S TaxID=3096037 RepID=UPI002ACA01AB|nr:D-2-hydroxyacid dehydrogenase [Pseudomonas sp. RP23018S]MDZ5601484.1 D-2-hydroxyacid dehydrogenase [Pseudomonas sp. RP23018S]